MRRSETLIARYHGMSSAVTESGLRTADDSPPVAAACYRAFLIGERFMIEPDPGGAKALLAGCVLVTQRRGEPLAHKICGITALEDAEAAVNRAAPRAGVCVLGPTALVHRSLSRAAIASALPAFVTKLSESREPAR